MRERCDTHGNTTALAATIVGGAGEAVLGRAARLGDKFACEWRASRTTSA